ncbi:unnamed protein product [Didymodactylos carnosus]|uniref:Tetraspanin n=2 Tax=Didymodactylos carnosus TaxID=1234261 RepID=A0A814VJF8_9BILA|nr:unnamed protein product [Didymodactylos carnosus]CAF3952646.1 unnamed protein product [Didymodactylos carnosus]
MAFSCGVKFSRALLFFLNLIFLIFGIVLLGFGIFIKTDKDFKTILTTLFKTTDVEGSAIRSLAYIMIIVGVITVIIAGFGFMGALWKNRCFLYMYAVILAILIIAELVGFILAFWYKGKLEEVYNNDLLEVFNKAYTKNETDTQKAIESIEERFKCCGISGPNDYTKLNLTVPSACFICGGPQTCTGCASKIIDFLKDKLPIFGGILGGFLLIEIFGVVSAISLGVAISHSPDRYSS